MMINIKKVQPKSFSSKLTLILSFNLKNDTKQRHNYFKGVENSFKG